MILCFSIMSKNSSGEKPDMANSVIGASAPPATITSASPLRMISAASPMAFAEAEHAVTVHETDRNSATYRRSFDN